MMMMTCVCLLQGTRHLRARRVGAVRCDRSVQLFRAVRAGGPAEDNRMCYVVFCCWLLAVGSGMKYIWYIFRRCRGRGLSCSSQVI